MNQDQIAFAPLRSALTKLGIWHVPPAFCFELDYPSDRGVALDSTCECLFIGESSVVILLVTFMYCSPNPHIQKLSNLGLAVFLEDLGSVPSTHMVIHNRL